MARPSNPTALPLPSAPRPRSVTISGTSAPALLPHQRHARAFLRSHARAGLFLDMGLGKTATVLSALEPRHLPALVVAPKRVAEETWPEELGKFRPDLTYALAAGRPAERRAAFAPELGADLVFVSRDNLASVPLRYPFKCVIIDELSSFKNTNSQRFRLMRKIVKNRDYVWGLTGTPTPNSLLELWPQMFLLDGGESLGKSVVAYRERWFTPADRLPSGVITSWDLRPGAERTIYDLIKPSVLSMQGATHLELPPVTYNSIRVTLPAKALKAIETFKKAKVLEVGKTLFTAANAAVLSGKFSQMSAGFIYHDDAEFSGKYTSLHTAKLDALDEVLEAATSPVLVFYRFKAEKDAIKARHSEAREIKDAGVIKEWNAGRVPLLLAHPESAGHGLNLQAGGHTIVWTSLPWSSEQWAQGNARLARQGQKSPVVIHTLEASGTIDARIKDVLGGKVSAQRALLDYLEER